MCSKCSILHHTFNEYIDIHHSFITWRETDSNSENKNHNSRQEPENRQHFKLKIEGDPSYKLDKCRRTINLLPRFQSQEEKVCNLSMVFKRVNSNTYFSRIISH